jgi:GTP cyclohydrolase I
LENNLPDVQNQKDTRNIFIDKVGISDLVYPIIVLDKENNYQNTIGKINMYVDLPEDFRGTHMSRFVEVLNDHRGKMTVQNMEKILDDMRNHLKAKTAHFEVEFDYFVLRKAPVSKIESYTPYKAKFLCKKNDDFDFILEVDVPVQTLCPCSKEISDYGAHNQRARANISIRMNRIVWIEDLINIAESSASTPLFTLLKREDEKYITENSYNNPKFVEDVVRDISMKLEKDERIRWYSVKVTSYESIHTHNAYACHERWKR